MQNPSHKNNKINNSDNSDFIILDIDNYPVNTINTNIQLEYLTLKKQQSESSGLNKKKNIYKNVYCVNCGEKGHVVKECTGPITSFGILAFKIVKNSEEEIYDKNIRLSNLINKCYASQSNISNIFP